MRRLVVFLLFLVFVDEDNSAYKKHMFAPFASVHDYLLNPTVIKIRPFDLVMLVILIAASMNRPPKDTYTPPMKRMVLLALGTTIVWYAYGLLRGGESRFASWQTYLFLSMILVAFTVAATFRTVAHFTELGKWLVVVALYRGVMCWISYFTWGRSTLGQSGAYLTNHDDTIAWVVAIIILMVDAAGRKSRLISFRNALFTLFLIGAIQFNSRRLAWVSLALGIAVTYLLFPAGKAKQTVKRVAKILVPVLALYVMVGWGRSSPIFLPLRSLESVTTHEDSSTLARNAENLNLIATARFAGPLFGTGWGWPYAAITRKYDIAGEFELWQYVPHNSILGLLAFTGILGLLGVWMALPTAVFLNARVARLGQTAAARNAGLIGVSQLMVCVNQIYGDMGTFSLQVMYVIGVGYAMAMRLPALGGAWAGAPAPARASKAAEHP